MKSIYNNEIDPLLKQALNLLSIITWEYGEPVSLKDETEQHVLSIKTESLQRADIDLKIEHGEQTTRIIAKVMK